MFRATSDRAICTPPPQADRASLRTLFRIWRSGRQLDLELAAGADPNGDPLHKERARELTDRGMRLTIATDLEEALPQLDGLAAPSASERTGRSWRSDIETIVERLRAPTAVSPAGVARALLLVTEPSSPLYRADAAEELERDSRATLRAIDQGKRVPD